MFQCGEGKRGQSNKCSDRVLSLRKTSPAVLWSDALLCLIATHSADIVQVK